MNFLVDAQLPRRLAGWLAHEGHDAIHTLDLPRQNRTGDRDLRRIAIEQDRVIVTKDADFVVDFLRYGPPPRLLLIATGNITNPELERIFSANLPAILSALAHHHFIELHRTSLTTHA